MIYELVAFNTDCGYLQNIRYLEYTKSKKKAEAFNKIPKIQFTDSGHGIVFYSHEHSGHRKPTINLLRNYVQEEINKITHNP